MVAVVKVLAEAVTLLRYRKLGDVSLYHVTQSREARHFTKGCVMTQSHQWRRLLQKRTFNLLKQNERRHSLRYKSER